MKSPLIADYEREVIKAYYKDSSRFRSKPLSVIRYEFAKAKRELCRAIINSVGF